MIISSITHQCSCPVHYIIVTVVISPSGITPLSLPYHHDHSYCIRRILMHVLTACHPAITRRSPDAGLRLIHYLRHWPNLKPASGQLLVFAERIMCYEYMYCQCTHCHRTDYESASNVFLLLLLKTNIN